MRSVVGLHHVTAISADPVVNLDYYTGTLGLRLVKRTVNQDSTGTYHLFYADAEGRPGTDLTFFPWPGMPPARPGVGLAMEVGFAVAPDTLDAWSARLEERGARVSIEERFGERALLFEEPHGLALSLTESSDTVDTVPWSRSPVAAEEQLRGFHAVRLWERDLESTGSLLCDVLGFERVGEEGGWTRFAVAGGGSGRLIEVRELPDGRRGAWGTGGVHHVAVRVEDDEHQAEVRERVAAAGCEPTPVIDRFWFRSVYFREPGGVLFELATDGPGFAVDEDPEHLGESLILPPWLEPRRDAIEAALPPLP